MSDALLDAYGNPVGNGPNFKMSRLLDPSRKIFEGPIKARYYNDRVAANGVCFHCRSKIHYEMRLTKGQSAAAERDPQFAKNLFDLMGDRLQEQHQCGLLYEGRDNIEDLQKELDRERRQ